MLFAMRAAVVLLAWTALLLPWERCHDLCHDDLHPALSGHACHGKACEGDDDAEPCGRTRNEATHETVEFVSLRPDAKVHPDAVALVHAADRAFAPVHITARLHPAVDHDPAPDLLRCTVLLL
jgi:hypothetical protein